MDRREAVKTVASFVGATSLSNLVLPEAFATSDPKAAPMSEMTLNSSTELKPKPMSFDPKKLKGLSEKMIQSHWENNYAGSVKTLNAMNKKIVAADAEKDFPPFALNGLKREHLLRTGSVVLHELYFDNLGGDGKTGGSIEKAVKTSFKDVSTWETEYRKMAQGLSGGSGWVVLGYNLHLKRLENYWSADHMHNAPFTVPLLVMDMYEHSYQMDYGAAAAKYIDAFFQNINLEAVDKRFVKAMRFAAL